MALITPGKDSTPQGCSVARALEVAGERWSLLIIRGALYGVRRCNDFLVHLAWPTTVSTIEVTLLGTVRASRALRPPRLTG
ncbi:hypothetical protein QF026_007489 [Streptomyces aurantiacus]|nr:hypothetical protein [Streptomyces aurantiacus]